MKLLRLRNLLAAVAVVAAILAVAAPAAESPRPPETTLGFGEFELSSTFRLLPPFTRYAQTWTAVFADGHTYVSGTEGGTTDGLGTIRTLISAGDLAAYSHGAALDYVRACLRPPGAPITSEIVAPDGRPLCVNVDGYGYGGEPAGEYAAAAVTPPSRPTASGAVAAARAAILAARG